MIKILKKDGVRVEDFNPTKIHRAIDMASDRAGIKLEPNQLQQIVENILNRIGDKSIIPVYDLHPIVIEETAVFSPKSIKAHSFRL